MLVRGTYYLLIDYINKPQFIIVSKTFCPRHTPIFLRILIRKVSKSVDLFWDLDDHIFNSGEISEKQAMILEENSKAIVVTSAFLKSKIKLKYQSKVILLPTTDGDFQGFNMIDLMKQRQFAFTHEIKLVWVATAGNIPSLLKILDTLDKAAALLLKTQNKKLVLTVVCNKPVEIEVSYLKIINIEWTRNKAKEEIFNAHIGIMPLIFDEYSLGKGGFKLIQYISTGLPVIASKVGFNEEVVDENCGFLVNDKEINEGWIDGILKLSCSFDEWSNYSLAAYKKWNSSFPFDNNLEVWKELLDCKDI